MKDPNESRLCPRKITPILQFRMKLLQALPKDSTVFGKEQGGNGFKTQSRPEGSQNSERNLNMLTASPRLQNSKYAN